MNPARTRLAAFAISGGIAGLAGVLFAYAQQNVVPGTYQPQASLTLFLAVAIAGVSSVPWAVVGAMGIEVAVVFGPKVYELFHSTTIETTLPLLLTGPVLLINAYFNPGGAAELGMRRRDDWLRWVARRRGIAVPALAADPPRTPEPVPVPSDLDPRGTRRRPGPAGRGIHDVDSGPAQPSPSSPRCGWVAVTILISLGVAVMVVVGLVFDVRNWLACARRELAVASGAWLPDPAPAFVRLQPCGASDAVRHRWLRRPRSRP